VPTTTITQEQRAGLYELVRNDLGGIGDISLALEARRRRFLRRDRDRRPVESIASIECEPMGCGRGGVAAWAGRAHGLAGGLSSHLRRRGESIACE
jgi:hypothetical protein